MKVSQPGSRGGTAAELCRAREELAEAEAGRRELRRELDAMVGRVAQLTARLCDYSCEGRLGKRRREDYALARGDGYGRPRGRSEYEGEPGHNERHDGRYTDRRGGRRRDERNDSYEDREDGSFYRVWRVREDQDWDGFRGPAPWRRDGSGGDGDAGFAA